MNSFIIVIGVLVLLIVGMGLLLWLLSRLGVFGLLKANACYGLVALGFTVFGLLGATLHKNLTGVAAWGAIPWLLAVLFGAVPMLVWGMVAIVRSNNSRLRIASTIFLLIAMTVPIWLLLEIISGG